MLSSVSDVSLRDLEVFVMASRTQSLREVARKLNLLPAHTSKIIKGLEEKLGVQLFRRSGSGVILTPEGLSVLDAAERICDISQEMVASSLNQSPLKRPNSGKLWTFGSIGFLSTYLLAPTICTLQRASQTPPRFRLVEFTHNDLVAHGLKGAFELALHISKQEWTHLWQSYLVGMLKWKLYARIDHPLWNGCNESDVVKYPFVVPTDWGTHGYAIGDDFCPLKVRHRQRGNEAATAETALEICRNSHQLTFVPEALASAWVLQGHMKSIEVAGWPLQEKEIYLSVKTDIVQKSLVKDLLKALQAVSTLRKELPQISP